MASNFVEGETGTEDEGGSERGSHRQHWLRLLGSAGEEAERDASSL